MPHSGNNMIRAEELNKAFRLGPLRLEFDCGIILRVSRSGGMADAADSKSVGLKTVRVQVPPPAHPWNISVPRFFIVLKKPLKKGMGLIFLNH